MLAEPGWLELHQTLLQQRWRLWRRGFGSTAAPWLSTADSEDWPAAAATLRRLRRASRWSRSHCLPRALALLVCAARRGRRGQLVLGTQRRDGQLRAHAWVRFGSVEYGADAPADGAFLPFPQPLDSAASRQEPLR
ncbi:MAG: lasso peptide biosynthesis B2 protein [Lysobacterales bacterium]